MYALLLLGQQLFKFVSVEIQIEPAVHCHRYVAGLFRDHNCYCIGDFRDAHGRTVTQSQAFGNIEIMRHGKDALCSDDATIAYHHCAIVQGGVLEEDCLNEALANIGVYWFAGTDDIIQHHFPLYDYEGSDLLLCHALTCHDHRHYIRCVTLLLAVEYCCQVLKIATRAYSLEEIPDLFVEYYNKRYRTHIHHLVKNGSQKTHVEYL